MKSWSKLADKLTVLRSNTVLGKSMIWHHEA